MICSQCKIDVEPDLPLMTCPECWSPMNLKWNPSIMDSSVNQAIKHRGALHAAKKLGCLPEHIKTMDLYFDLMMGLDRMYNYEDDRYSSVEILEGDTVIEIEERVVVSVVVTAAIISFFVLNEIFGLINY